MSVESAKAFTERMKTDEDFAKKIMECKDPEARMAAVQAAGYDFSSAEIQQLHEELSDADLERVAGGAWSSHEDCAVRYPVNV